MTRVIKLTATAILHWLQIRHCWWK